MGNYEQKIDTMDPEEMFDFVEQLESELKLESEQERTADEIEKMFELLHARSATGQHAEAGESFRQLRGIIETFRESTDDVEKWLDFFIDWSLLSLRFTPEKQDEFVCMPIYVSLFEEIRKGPESMKYREIHARLQLGAHYLYWLGKGGSPDVLTEEDIAFFEREDEGFVEAFKGLAQKHEEKEDWEVVSKLKRTASHYYLSKDMPNEAISEMKAILEILPKIKDFHNADRAETQMQIGQIFLNHKKFDVAIRYFSMAKELYEESGEEFEMFAYQAEGWMEEAEKRKGY